MRKKPFLFFLFLAATVMLPMVEPALPVYATEETEYVEEIPESYYWDIETNNIENWPQGPQVEAEAASVMDVDTGAFLYGKNMEAKMYPASITKIMTTLVAIENMDLTKLDKKIKASAEALSTIESDSSQIWLSPGEKITMRDALYAIMLASANDAANVVAEKVGGSIENFVQMMNDKAKELGCVNTNFVNPHGLHDENHYTCARDMALITQAAYENPLFREITKRVEYMIPKTKFMDEDRWMINHQKMLYEDGDYSYEGCVGGKTGFTDEAWNTLVTIAKKDGKTLVCVELRVNGSWKTFRESAALLDYGFHNFRHAKVSTGLENRTLGEILGVCRFGRTAILNTDQLEEKVIEGNEEVTVTLPEGVKKNKLTRTMTGGKWISYSYKDWNVGTGEVSIKHPAVVLEEPEELETELTQIETRQATPPESETNLKEYEPEGMDKKVDKYMNSLTAEVMNIWDSFNNWVNANELIAAVVGFILILLLIPLLIIAYIRDRQARLIRKEREIEQEALKQMEESIENKSVQEIEAELRAELEKERLAKEKEEQRKRDAAEAERKMAEMEAVIDGHTESAEIKTAENETSEKEAQENKTENGELKEAEHELGSTD